MEEIFKADIFFVITSVAVVFVTVAMLVVLYYVYRTVKAVKELAENTKEQSDALLSKLNEDTGAISHGVKKYGSKVASLVMVLAGEYVKKKIRSKKRKKK